jgi:pyrroloquinoline quinone (PQQ) biosynthesis protein C
MARPTSSGSSRPLAPTRPRLEDIRVERLVQEALRHRAVRHPYLDALAVGDLPDLRWALADFARAYRGYSAWFPRYLTAVVSRLDRAEHRAALLDNLAEECGRYEGSELEALARAGVDPAWVEGVPHPELFARFARAIGAETDDAAVPDQVACWRELLLLVVSSGSAAEAVGAMGLGTETIVRSIYPPFVTAIERLGTLSPRDAVFFPLHAAVDDHHQRTLKVIAADLAATETGARELRRGMLKALQLRSAFWDWLHARAVAPARAEEAV